MALTSKHDVAQILRREAESLRRHGFTNFFSHQYVCLLAQVLRPEKCEGCLLGDYVPEEFRQEAFPCQHITQETWERIARMPGLPEKVADRFLEIAAELEREAKLEESPVVPPVTR
ncbi:MAG: hypothetical protein HYY26_02540 [Acidobacteria bacterium]|nr:hypothetical protein [Acidobacteriota bacterium]